MRDPTFSLFLLLQKILLTPIECPFYFAFATFSLFLLLHRTSPCTLHIRQSKSPTFSLFLLLHLIWVLRIVIFLPAGTVSLSVFSYCFSTEMSAYSIMLKPQSYLSVFSYCFSPEKVDTPEFSVRYPTFLLSVFSYCFTIDAWEVWWYFHS